MRDPADGGVVLARDVALVTLRPGSAAPAPLREEGEPIGAAAVHWLVPGTLEEDAAEVAARWRLDPAVRDAIPDLILPRRRAAAPLFDDPGYPDQWYLEDLGMESLFERSLGDLAVRVAIIDSGIDVRHPDLDGATADPLDTVDGDTDPSPIPDEACPDGEPPGTVCDDHGTAVAGIVGARAGNGVDFVGLCPECTLIPIRTISDLAPVSAEIDAFEHAIEAGASVINNSWGYASAIRVPTATQEVIERAATEGREGLGAVVVFAAGNDDRKVTREEITNVAGVICVSAVDHYQRPTQYSNYGPTVDVSAYSATVSIAPGGITTTFGGTSAAAPVVSGIAGWLLSQEPDLTATEVRELLVATANKPGTVTFDAAGHHERYGYGIVDPPALLAAISAGPSGEAPGGGGCGCAGGGPAGAIPAALGLLAARRRRA